MENYTAVDIAVGPDGFTVGEWARLDLTCFPKSKRQGYSNSQGPAVQIVSYRAGRYTVRDANGFTFRACVSELSESALNRSKRQVHLVDLIAQRNRRLAEQREAEWVKKAHDE